jgi:hypothetical protein
LSAFGPSRIKAMAAPEIDPYYTALPACAEAGLLLQGDCASRQYRTTAAIVIGRIRPYSSRICEARQPYALSIDPDVPAGYQVIGIWVPAVTPGFRQWTSRTTPNRYLYVSLLTAERIAVRIAIHRLFALSLLEPTVVSAIVVMPVR